VILPGRSDFLNFSLTLFLDWKIGHFKHGCESICLVTWRVQIRMRLVQSAIGGGQGKTMLVSDTSSHVEV